jgi:hypothetical protein
MKSVQKVAGEELKPAAPVNALASGRQQPQRASREKG